MHQKPFGYRLAHHKYNLTSYMKNTKINKKKVYKPYVINASIKHFEFKIKSKFNLLFKYEAKIKRVYKCF